MDLVECDVEDSDSEGEDGNEQMVMNELQFV